MNSLISVVPVDPQNTLADPARDAPAVPLINLPRADVLTYTDSLSNR